MSIASTRTLETLDGMSLVVGLGRSGLSAVRALHSHGASVVVTDSRQEPPELPVLQRDFPNLPRYLGGFDAGLFAKAARLVVSPGVSVQTPEIAAAAARGIPVWGDVELFAQSTQVPIVAITGSNGKSTVTTLLGLMAEKAGLKTAVGGNLGIPALDLLAAEKVETPDLYVLELSSFQLETTYSLNAKAAVVLNISPDHLDRYATLNDYIHAKRRIFRGDGYMVLNADDPTVIKMREPGRQVMFFSTRAPEAGAFGLIRRQGKIYLAYGDEPWLAAESLKIEGIHNLANALAALTLGFAIGLDRTAMVAALCEFSGLPHRSQLIAEHQGIRWYDDSKGTNIGATIAAVTGMSGPLIVIAGGLGKGQDFTPLRAVFKDKVRALVLIGRDASLLVDAVADVVPTHHAASMEQAVELAAELAQPGDKVLLSPACASFDMFSGFEERGLAFAKAVRSFAQ